MMRILIMSHPLTRRWTVNPRRLIWMLLLRKTVITGNLEPPPMKMMYKGILYTNKKGHLKYRVWVVSINMKKMHTTTHNL